MNSISRSPMLNKKKDDNIPLKSVTRDSMLMELENEDITVFNSTNPRSVFNNSSK